MIASVRGWWVVATGAVLCYAFLVVLMVRLLKFGATRRAEWDAWAAENVRQSSVMPNRSSSHPVA
jgi:hypothetical protein